MERSVSTMAKAEVASSSGVVCAHHLAAAEAGAAMLEKGGNAVDAAVAAAFAVGVAEPFKPKRYRRPTSAVQTAYWSTVGPASCVAAVARSSRATRLGFNDSSPTRTS